MQRDTATTLDQLRTDPRGTKVPRTAAAMRGQECRNHSKSEVRGGEKRKIRRRTEEKKEKKEKKKKKRLLTSGTR